MSDRQLEEPMRIDADELVIFEDPQVVGDTFIYEPSAAESGLGKLFATAEASNKDSLGRELIDTVIQALQREYYRDPGRGVLTSFESALHQANLILHDLVEQGVRDWMGSFHVSLGVLSNNSLHISTAGNGVILLARNHRLTEASAGLSHSLVTDPLRTFAQVASGTVCKRDILFFGSSRFNDVFRQVDISRLVFDYSASTIAMRLQQLYEDQQLSIPVAALVISVLPKHIAMLSERPAPKNQRAPVREGSLQPRLPLAINTSLFKRTLKLAGRIIVWLWRKILTVVWPIVKAVSQRGGVALYKASRTAGKGVQTATASQLKRLHSKKLERSEAASSVINNSGLLSMQTRRWSLGDAKAVLRPGYLWQKVKAFIRSMPKSSKLFGVIAVLLALALVISIVLLQQKRETDREFKYASELLQEARTKKDAAETALIYDNREQARALLNDATMLAQQLKESGLYQDQLAELEGTVKSVTDRLDKITRVSPEAVREVGSFSTVITDAVPTRLFYVNGDLFTFDPNNNNIAKMGLDGKVSVVSKTTRGVGFFQTGVEHGADKSLLLVTDAPGLVLYDTKTELMQKQEIDFSSDNPVIKSIATFGNRIYLYDKSANNIYGYGKTLRGYSGGNAWITDKGFAADTIEQVGVDGYIYALHTDGSVSKMLKGSPVEFNMEEVEPPIPPTARMIINENLRHLFFFDAKNKRIAVFDTKGNLNRQLFLAEDTTPVDIAVDPEETRIFVLDGNRVLEVSLTD